MKIIIFFGFLFIISQNVNSQPTGWVWSNPQPTGNSLSDIHIVENLIYFCGEIGTILRTSNNGLSWTLLNSYTDKPLNDLNFINAETGFASGVNVIMKTTNAGASWFPIFSNYRIIYSTDIISPSIIFASNGKTIFKSINGGSTWDSIASNFSSVQNYTINSFDFINKDTGFVTGNPDIVMRTTDGGITWMNQVTPQNKNYYSIAFSNGIGLMTHVGVTNGIKRTTNLGINWTCIFCDSGNVSYEKKIDFKGSLAAVTGNKFYYSTNTGISWQIRDNPSNTLHEIQNCAIDDSNNVYLIRTNDFYGSHGEIFKSSNFGTNWSTVSKNYLGRTVNCLIFGDSSTIFIGGYPDLRGFILRSTDAGISWDTTYRDSNAFTYLRDFIKINNSIYFAFGDNGLSLKTTNGGNTWIKLNISTAGFTEAAYNNNSLFVASNVGRIFRSTDLGITWQNDTILNGNSITGLYFINSNTGFLIEGPRVRRTTNSGTSWEILFTGTSGLQDIAFFDASTGLITDHAQNLHRTTNGGYNWQLIAGELTLMNKISIVDNNISYVVGNAGRIFKTTDKGDTWSQQKKISSKNLKCVDFLNERIGGAGGDYGTILLTYNGGTVGIANNASIIKEYHLRQNYPNPFNPSTKIQFAIPKNGFVTLKVYDMLGREVSTLVSQQLTTGTYNFDFNGANLTSGVYFYKLDVQGQFSETKKMLLVK